MKVFIELVNLRFFDINGWGIDLDYSDIEWFALETNRDHSVVFEFASKYCIYKRMINIDLNFTDTELLKVL